MTLLIAGHETTAAVLTWTLHCLVDHPEFMQPLQHEVHLSSTHTHIPLQACAQAFYDSCFHPCCFVRPDLPLATAYKTVLGEQSRLIASSWTWKPPDDKSPLLESAAMSGVTPGLQVDTVLGDRKATMADLRRLAFTTRVINESMRLYPQPPVLIRRALEADVFAGYAVPEGSDLFISVWNLHRYMSLPGNLYCAI